MRVWFIDPSYLDGQRLIAAHNEIHICNSCVYRGREWGQTRILKYYMQWVSGVHNLIVQEMGERARVAGRILNHTTPFDVTGLPEEFLNDGFTPTEEMLRRDVEHLRQKWVSEAYFNGVGRRDLRELEQQYGMAVGLDPEQAERQRELTRDFVRENKLWFDEFRRKKPKSRMQDRILAILRERGYEVLVKWQEPFVSRIYSGIVGGQG